tara:strand:- start:450 stop:944 length:495 start_codon:yes stop_codon:yes gene_type:complete
MFKDFFKNNLSSFITVFIIFFIDRVFKFYIIELAEQQIQLDIYLNEYLNIYLIWNKGIAFGLMSFNSSVIYNLITLMIVMVCIIILIMITRFEGLKKYLVALILGGALGNLFDRIYYGAVPDFIDLHFKSFHWFVFNIADIFITIGIFCLIYVELFLENKKNEK